MENSDTTALGYSSVVKYETSVTPTQLALSVSFGYYVIFRSKGLRFVSYNVEGKRQVARGLGVPHTVEAFAIWGLDSRSATPPASYSTTNAAIIPVVQGYWTSFIRTFNPNTFRADGSPEWEPFGDDQDRLLFETNATRMETVPSDQKERCDFFISIGIELEQ